MDSQIAYALCVCLVSLTSYCATGSLLYLPFTTKKGIMSDGPFVLSLKIIRTTCHCSHIIVPYRCSTEAGARPDTSRYLDWP